MNKQNLKNQRAITLIALIITIVILLILAIVAIRAVQNSGIIGHAQNASSKYTIAQEKEQIGLALSEWKIQKLLPGNTQSFYDVVDSALNDTADVTDNQDETLTVTFTTGNVYVVDENGNIIEQEYEKDKVTGDFEITVSQELNGLLRIRAIIPESWNEREFTVDEEDLAAQIVGSDMELQNSDGSAVSNLEELIIAGVNEEYGDLLISTLGSTFSKNDYETMIPIMQSMLPSDVDISTVENAFKYMMVVMGQEYETVQQYAQDVYEYEATNKVLKIRKNGGEWIDITNKATWKDDGYRNSTYQITDNGIYEVLLELDDKKSISEPIEIVDTNLGTYAIYDTDGDKSVEDETILWRVLRNDKNKVELISADALGGLDLRGNADFNEARIKYNNAVDLIVAECKRVTGITENIRNVGGPAIDETTMNDTVDFSELTSFTPTVSIEEFNKYEGTENGLKKGDEEEKYLEDYNQMQKSGTTVANNSQAYWFASRRVYLDSYNAHFKVLYSLAGGRCYDCTLCSLSVNSYAYNDIYDYSLAVRPVLTLESGILDNATQTGTKDDPIEIYQDK